MNGHVTCVGSDQRLEATEGQQMLNQGLKMFLSARSSLSDVCSRVSHQFGLNQLFDDVKTDVMIDS